MKKITSEKMGELIDIWCEHPEDAIIGQFYCFDNNCWTGCDNSTGQCWVEDFKTEEDVIKWFNAERVCDVNGVLLNG